MKRKIFALIALAVICCAILCGCVNDNPKQFVTNEMTITLNGQFVEKQEIGRTACFESIFAAVIVNREDMSAAGALCDNLSQYTQLVIKNAQIDVRAEQQEGKNYMQFEYEKVIGNRTYYYFATTHHMQNDVYWLVQFMCASADKQKYQNNFVTWADSITFATSAAAAI